MDYRLHLRTYLPNIKCREYLNWVAMNENPNLEGHHLLGQKYCDFLIAKLRPEVHHSNAINTDFQEHYELAISLLGKYARYKKKAFQGSLFYKLDDENLIPKLIKLFNSLLDDQATLQSNDDTFFDISA